MNVSCSPPRCINYYLSAPPRRGRASDSRFRGRVQLISCVALVLCVSQHWCVLLWIPYQFPVCVSTYLSRAALPLGLGAERDLTASDTAAAVRNRRSNQQNTYVLIWNFMRNINARLGKVLLNIKCEILLKFTYSRPRSWTVHHSCAYVKYQIVVVVVVSLYVCRVCADQFQFVVARAGVYAKE